MLCVSFIHKSKTKGASMKNIFVIHLLVLLLLVGTWGLAEAVEALKPYDTFQVGPISPDRWSGSQFNPGNTGPYEAARIIIQDPEGRHLRLLNRSYGQIGSNSGTSLSFFRLGFSNPSPITTIRARIRVLSFKSKGCPNNLLDATSADARIFGFFFNSGVGDVIAEVGVERSSNSADPPGVLRIVYFVFQCLNVDCLSLNLLNTGSLGTVTTGQWVKLLLQWDKDGNQFIFQRGSQTPVPVSYGNLPDDAPPVVQFKSLEAANFLANCDVAPRPVGMVDALFDDVSVNESALPQ